MKMHHYKLNTSIRLILLAGLLSGCIGAGSSASITQIPLPTPTLSPLFLKPSVNISNSIKSAPTPDVYLIQEPTIDVSTIITPTQDIPVTSTQAVTYPSSTPTPVPTPNLTQAITDTIYAGTVNPNWALQISQGATYELQNISHAMQGKTSLAITPSQAGSTFLFLVRPVKSVQYLHNNVLGITFWLNSGDNTLQPGDLSVTVIASDKYPYYQYNDQSANSSQLLTRSGTRVYDLGLNRPVPPNTWVQIELNLDHLVYDPGFQPTPVVDTNYQYVTGFYLTMESNSLQTFYLNKVGILHTP